MAATRTQTKSFDSGGYTTSFNFSFDSSVTAGNLLVVVVYHGGGATCTISDSAGNTWNKLDDSGDAPPYADGTWWYCVPATGGNLTMTVEPSDYSYAVGIAREYSGLISSPLDKKAENLDGGYTTNHATGTTDSTTQATELVVAVYVADSATFSYTISGFSNKLEANNGTYGEVVIADKDVTSTGTQSGTFVGSDTTNGWAGIATFKEVVAGTVVQDVIQPGIIAFPR